MDIKEEVSIVNCRTYNQKEVDRAVEKALGLINFKFRPNSKILIKPNIVGSFPKNQAAITTNPAVIESVCKILKKHNCKIYIGDSPFTNPEQSFKASGINRLKKYAKIVIFEQEKLTAICDNKAKFLKKFQIARLVKEVDLIIDMPKLKTHTLTKFTGAIKNLYGCIPGGLKQKIHNNAHGDKKFSKLLVDIYQNIMPGLAIMDGIIGMEGEGPTSGEAKKAGLILASKNPVALDIIASKIISYNPKRIYAIKEAIKRKLAKRAISIKGMKEIPKIYFKKPTTYQHSRAKKLILKLFKEKPIVCDTGKCIKCGVCRNHCPKQAISMKPYPEVDKRKCIRCFCCIEICPQNAMMIKQD